MTKFIYSSRNIYAQYFNLRMSENMASCVIPSSPVLIGLCFRFLHICRISVVPNNRRLSPSSFFKSLPPLALYISYICYLLQVIHLALRDLRISGVFLHFHLPLLSQYCIIYIPHNAFLRIQFLQLYDFPPCFSNSSPSPEIVHCRFYPSSSSLVRLVHRLERAISVWVDRY